MPKVFLGGTCNESTWRNRMMIYLYEAGLEYYNPVVNDWTEDDVANEILQRESCDFCLYAITPKMTGVYAIAEVVDDSNKRPEKTILVLLREDGREKFTEDQWESLGAVAKMVNENGAQVFTDLKVSVIWLGEKRRFIMKEKEDYIDFGQANSWFETPELVKRCVARKHSPKQTGVGRCLTEVKCELCRYKYLIDSSD